MKKEIRRFYWNNGQLSDEIPYKNGKEHGLSKYWHDNGQCWGEIPYKNDIQCGAKINFEY